MTKDEVFRRGQQAERILTDPLVLQTFTAIEEQLTREWRESGPGDLQRREDAWRTLRLLSRLRSNLESFMRSAKMDKQIAELQSKGFFSRFE